MSARPVTVTVLGCNGIPKVQRIGIQDPFIIVSYQGQEYRTRTHVDGGCEPRFSDSFALSVAAENALLDLTILNDSKRHDDVIGKAKINFANVFETGTLHSSFPVADAHGQPHGTVELSFSCSGTPMVASQVAPAAPITQPMAALTVSGGEGHESFFQALTAARVKHYAETAAALQPHEKLCSAVESEVEASMDELKQQAQDELQSAFEEPRKKAKELLDEVLHESTVATAHALKDFQDAVAKEVPDAVTKHGSHIQELVGHVTESDFKRTKKVEAAQAMLQAGIAELAEKFKAAIFGAYGGFGKEVEEAVLRYKQGVETQLRQEAEKKCLEEAALVAPPPPPGSSLGVPPPPPPVYAVSPVVVGPAPVHAPVYLEAAAPPALPSPRPAAAPAAAPSPAPAPSTAPSYAPLVYQPPPPKQEYAAAASPAPVSYAPAPEYAAPAPSSAPAPTPPAYVPAAYAPAPAAAYHAAPQQAPSPSYAAAPPTYSAPPPPTYAAAPPPSYYGAPDPAVEAAKREAEEAKKKQKEAEAAAAAQQQQMRQQQEAMAKAEHEKKMKAALLITGARRRGRRQGMMMGALL